MSYNQKLVSIIMPAYNSGKFIEESIISVRNQTYVNWELLITDDCSIDNTGEIVSKYAAVDKRIKFFKTEKNSGAAVARNISISNASGEYIAFLDSDDLWDENKLNVQIQFMEKNGYYFTYSNYYIKKKNKIIKFHPKKSFDYKRLLFSNDIGCLTAIYNSLILGKIYMPLNAEKREDFAAWLFVLKKGITAYKVDEYLATYRVVGNSVSKNKFKMIKYQFLLYKNSQSMNVFKALIYTFISIIFKLFKY